MNTSLATIPSSKKGSNFRVIQRKSTELAKQNVSKADVLNQFISNVKTILNKAAKVDKRAEQDASIQAIVKYIKDTIYGKPNKLEIDDVDCTSLQDQIQYLCANDGYFACGHQEVTRGTIKMLYNLWDEDCQIQEQTPVEKERTYDAFITWLDDDKYKFPIENIKLAGSRARGYFSSIHKETSKNNKGVTLMFGNSGYAAASKDISVRRKPQVDANLNESQRITIGTITFKDSSAEKAGINQVATDLNQPGYKIYYDPKNKSKVLQMSDNPNQNKLYIEEISKTYPNLAYCHQGNCSRFYSYMNTAFTTEYLPYNDDDVCVLHDKRDIEHVFIFQSNGTIAYTCTITNHIYDAIDKDKAELCNYVLHEKAIINPQDGKIKPEEVTIQINNLQMKNEEFDKLSKFIKERENKYKNFFELNAIGSKTNNEQNITSNKVQHHNKIISKIEEIVAAALNETVNELNNAIKSNKLDDVDWKKWIYSTQPFSLSKRFVKYFIDEFKYISDAEIRKTNPNWINNGGMVLVRFKTSEEFINMGRENNQLVQQNIDKIKHLMSANDLTHCQNIVCAQECEWSNHIVSKQDIDSAKRTLEGWKRENGAMITDQDIDQLKQYFNLIDSNDTILTDASVINKLMLDSRSNRNIYPQG